MEGVIKVFCFVGSKYYFVGRGVDGGINFFVFLFVVFVY